MFTNIFTPIFVGLSLLLSAENVELSVINKEIYSALFGR
jgi:hypothetical protein